MGKALHEKLYTYGLWSSYLIFAVTSLGLWSSGTQVLSKLEFLLNVYIALFLIYQFNPYNKTHVSDFGRGIAFSAGILLLLTKSLKGYISNLQNKEITTALDVLQETDLEQVGTEIAELAELGELGILA
jgi:hypothetical protein